MGKLENLTPQKQTGNKLLMGLSAEFSKRFMAVEQVHLLAMATLLDPRFKKMYFKNAVVCSKHVNYFSGLITKHVTQQEQIDSSSSDSEPAGLADCLVNTTNMCKRNGAYKKRANYEHSLLCLIQSFLCI